MKTLLSAATSSRRSGSITAESDATSGSRDVGITVRGTAGSGSATIDVSWDGTNWVSTGDTLSTSAGLVKRIALSPGQSASVNYTAGGGSSWTVEAG